MGAHVQHHEGVVLGGFEIGSESFVVKTLCNGVVISVFFGLEANDISERFVNGPGWVGDQVVNIFVWVPLLEEHKSKSESTCT